MSDIYDKEYAVEISNLIDTRKTNQKQLWVCGCSISAGEGVTDETRYGNLLAEKLYLPVSTLAYSGASNRWAADQLLRSDIRKYDTVVFGVTSHNRIPFLDPKTKKIEHICFGKYTREPAFNSIVSLDYLDSPSAYYTTVAAANSVRNFCNKVGAKLVLAGLYVWPEFAPYLQDLPEYLHLNHNGPEKENRYLDLGTDNMHPGPLTHAWYADEIFRKLNE